MYADLLNVTPAPLYQRILIMLLVPPLGAAFLCLRIKGMGKELGTSKTKMVRNATDWTAFLAFTITGYIVAISVMILAHYQHH
jgi:hypothetical protein